MRLIATACVCLAAATAIAVVPESRFWVFPPVKAISASGETRAVSPRLAVSTSGSNDTSHILSDAITRHAALWLASSRPVATSAVAPLAALRVQVASANERLDAATDYSYSIRISATDDTAVISAQSVYGAMYALSSLGQLLAAGGGALPASAVSISDAPDWPHRGLMIDAGRRFFPVPLVQNLIDTMALAKLNLLHLHVSDECRFGIESKLFPNLTTGLTGDYGGFYTQADITALVGYGQARGVRIMLEIDIPGHSRGLLPLAGYGAVFCDPADPTCSQLYGDPANKTYDVLTALLGEMAPLFIEPIVHIGCDETGVVGPCTVDSTFQVERYVLDYLQNTLGKTPAGWEEVLFDASAATPQTVVYAWARHDPASIVSQGYQAVDNNASHWYLTSPGGIYPGGWTSFYYEIASGLSPAEKALVQGGEMSQWTDTYCITDQCGASGGAPPVASSLFPPAADAAFAKSIGGMIFPRALVGAAAFWSYNASLSPTDPAFVAAVWALNDQVVAAGGVTCPTDCACDQLTQCGQPIVPPTPPAAGMALGSGICALPTPLTQSFALGADGRLQVAGPAAPPLCVSNPGGGSGDQTYPLKLADCGDAVTVRWTHNGTLGSRLVDQASGGCMDLAGTAIGIYDCGTDEGLLQLNQAWNVDHDTGVLINFKAGLCLTASAASRSA